jgi:hypothetical protein
MQNFPYGAVEVIVEGLEAGMEFLPVSVRRYLKSPAMIHTLEGGVRRRICALRDAQKRVEDLRIQRYLRVPR